MRRTREEAEKTRVAILEAAEQLFLDKGVAHTTLDAVARQAGVTRGAIYWHFENKAHLFHALVEQVRLPPEQLAQRLGATDNGDPLGRLMQVCVETLQSLNDNPRKRHIVTILMHRCEFTDELRDAEVRHNAFIDQFLTMCETLFEAERRRLRDGLSPRLAARGLHALIVGILSDGTRDPELRPTSDELETLFQAYLRGILLP